MQLEFPPVGELPSHPRNSFIAYSHWNSLTTIGQVLGYDWTMVPTDRCNQIATSSQAAVRGELPHKLLLLNARSDRIVDFSQSRYFA
jgi:hypothetical protein